MTRCVYKSVSHPVVGCKDEALPDERYCKQHMTTVQALVSKKVILQIDGLDFVARNREIIGVIEQLKCYPLLESHLAILRTHRIAYSPKAVHCNNA